MVSLCHTNAFKFDDGPVVASPVSSVRSEIIRWEERSEGVKGQYRRDESQSRAASDKWAGAGAS